MKPGDLVRFRREYVEYDGADDPELTHATGIIISDRTNLLDLTDDKQLFDVMICGRMVGAFDYEIEVIDEAG
jgi:hypothetical protein